MRIALLGSTVAVLSAVTLFSAEARADLSSCGHINVQANANCTLDASGGCTAKCTPVNFHLACQGQLSASCQGSCNASATASCNTSCTADCSGKCTANPGSFSCSGECTSNCNASCTSQCSSSADSATCTSQCQANCSTSCQGKCSGTAPSASCDAQCSASCDGSCTAQVNASCNIDCQTKGEASCESSLQGGCTAQCSQPKGALFCDGQYVDTGDNLQNCIDALKDELNITVSASASGDCTGNTCEGQAQASAKCAVASGSPLTGLGIFAGTAAAVFAVMSRTPRSRRRRKSA